MEIYEDIWLRMAREFMTDKWFAHELGGLYRKNPLREVASVIDQIHPYIADYVDVRVALRMARGRKMNCVAMPPGYQNTLEFGRNLYELQGRYDPDSVRTRLQDKNLFDDAVWELEATNALRYAGLSVSLKHKFGSFDIAGRFADGVIAVECKQKHVSDSNYTASSVFSALVSERLLNWLHSQPGRIDVRVTVLDVARLSDVKPVSQALIEMLIAGRTRGSYQDAYALERVSDYEGMPTPAVLKNGLEDFCHNSVLDNSPKYVYEGSGNYYYTTITYLGSQYLGLAFSKYRARQMTVYELSGYLGVKVDKIPALEAAWGR